MWRVRCVVSLLNLGWNGKDVEVVLYGGPLHCANDKVTVRVVLARLSFHNVEVFH